MAEQLGGKVVSSNLREFGYAQIRARGHSDLFKDIQDETNDEGHGLLNVWMSHGDQVASLPKGFKSIASTDNTAIAAMADEDRKFYGLQFHPEVTHTTQGMKILERFLHEIVGCQSLWTTEKIVDDSITRVKEKVGSDKVLLALSGGVDSSVVAAPISDANSEADLPSIDVPSTRKKSLSTTFAVAAKTFPFEMPVVTADTVCHALPS